MLLWFFNKKTEFGVYFSDFWKWDDMIRGGVPAGCPNLLLKIVHVFDEPSLLLLQVQLVALAHLRSALAYWQLLQRLLKLLLCLSQTRLQSEGVQRGHGLGSGEGDTLTCLTDSVGSQAHLYFILLFLQIADLGLHILFLHYEMCTCLVFFLL